VTGRNFYQVLGIPYTASPTEVRAAYTRLVRRHHPDVAGELPGRLHDIQQAYRCLSDSEARARHDRGIADIERLHLKRQRRVQRRLGRYDRRHHHAPPRPYRKRRWPSLLMVAVGIAIVVRLSALVG
jgi:DnaJ-class molecular chaperone